MMNGAGESAGGRPELVRLAAQLIIEEALEGEATNLLERLFGGERPRTKVIPEAFGERAVLKLMYAALVRAEERWRGIRV